ncbi:uncharacterized protein LOC108674997 [Hyalella azteca]|uniref:Uncharacterized protein LOC108674997 n=1 Tax=Hyalella azteca TaxID=294128 RepID=A0A8B7NXE8_HYAAZ|nr:uncharacterized protein LOC108674997 [Hyalella azteca]
MSSNASFFSNVHFGFGVTGIAAVVGLTIGLALYFNDCVELAYYVIIISGFILLLVVVGVSISVRCLLTRPQVSARHSGTSRLNLDPPPPYQKSWGKEYYRQQSDEARSSHSSDIASENNSNQIFHISTSTLTEGNKPQDFQQVLQDLEAGDNELPNYEEAIRQLSVSELDKVAYHSEKTSSNYHFSLTPHFSWSQTLHLNSQEPVSYSSNNSSDISAVASQSISFPRKNDTKSFRIKCRLAAENLTAPVHCSRS